MSSRTMRHMQLQTDTIARPRRHLRGSVPRPWAPHCPCVTHPRACHRTRLRHGHLSRTCSQYKHCGTETRYRVCWNGGVGAGKGQWEGTWEGQGMWSPSGTVLDGHPWLTHACCFRRPGTNCVSSYEGKYIVGIAYIQHHDAR
jgi:hypothetical protein